MGELELERLKNMLLQQRKDLFTRYRGRESDRQSLSERDIEWEEVAQKGDLSTLFDQLDDREIKEIEEIDLALTKIEAATYGSCEICRKPIALERLEALPATRFCQKCARKAEEKPAGPAVPP